MPWLYGQSTCFVCLRELQSQHHLADAHVSAFSRHCQATALIDGEWFNDDTNFSCAITRALELKV